MRVLVTGAAGFIGSHVVAALALGGHEVHGVDSLTPYYDPSIKRRNLAEVGEFLQTMTIADVRDDRAKAMLGTVDAVVHLAAQPGVRESWGAAFSTYVEANVLATQELLASARAAGSAQFVFASSSSIYGDTSADRTEREGLRPVSPYGITKLAGEDLCRIYGASFGVRTLSLRLFTVYGPRQRPDMAVHRIIRAALTGDAFALLGDGHQRRHFTYVSDVAAAFVAALDADHRPSEVIDVAAERTFSLVELIAAIEAATGRSVRVVGEKAAPGDPYEVSCLDDAAKRVLGWVPTVGLEAGIKQQIDWQVG